MDSVGMVHGKPLFGCCAGRAGAFEPHHADGYNFTGADPSVRTLEDAVRHSAYQHAAAGTEYTATTP